MAVQARGRETRQTILESAFGLFLAQGYHGTSMRQVARAAGVSPATIYNHFNSKEALFVELLRERVPHRALIQALQEVQGDSTEERLHDAMQRMRAAMAHQFDNLRLMFIELLEFQGRHVGFLSSEIVPQALSYVLELQAHEPRLRSLSPMLILRAIAGIFMSYAISMAFFRDVPGFHDDQQELHALTDILLFGLLGQTEGQAPDGTPAT